MPFTRLDGYDLCGEAADVLTASAIGIDEWVKESRPRICS